MSINSKEVMDALEQVLLAEKQAKSLHAYIMTYAEALNYPHVMDYAHDKWHFGKHAEVASEVGMVALAQLFRMAWDISIIALEVEPQRLRSIIGIANEYCGAKGQYSPSKKLFVSVHGVPHFHRWGGHASAKWFSAEESRRSRLVGDAVWMTPLEAQEMLLSEKLPTVTEQRQAVADEEFQRYDFGADVTDMSGWEHSTADDEWTRSVYICVDPDDEDSLHLTFTIRFYPDGSDIAESYAIDSKGQLWGEVHGPNSTLKALAKKLGWSEAETRHAIDSAEVMNDDENESVVLLGNGREIRTPAYPAPCTYVRVVQEGVEIAHWVDDEWDDAPQEVMGAIMGCAKGPANVTPEARALSLREQAARLLQEANKLDGLNCFSVTHAHNFGSTSYVMWDTRPALTPERAALVCEGAYEEAVDTLYIDTVSFEELAGLKHVVPQSKALELDQDDSISP